MAPTNPLVEEYLQRAAQPDVPMSPPTLPKTSTPAQFISQPNSPESHVTQQFTTTPARNRSTVKRTISTFNLMLLLVGSAVVIVLYVSNIIAIGQLMNDINILHQREQRLLTDQEILRAHVNRMAGSERIRAIAEQQLGLTVSSEQPVWFSVDADRVAGVEQQLDAIHEARKGIVARGAAVPAEKKAE